MMGTILNLAELEVCRASLKDGYFVNSAGIERPAWLLERDCTQLMSFSVDGEAEFIGRKFQICYPEPRSEFGNSMTTLVVNVDERKVVTMVRSGDVKSAMRFDLTEPIQSCLLEAEGASFTYMIRTNDVIQSIEGYYGTIFSDYFILANGSEVQRNQFVVSFALNEEGL